MSDFDLPDVNVLVALVLPDHVHHLLARQWFRSVSRFATTPITETGFVRVALNPQISGTATPKEVMAALDAIRTHPRAIFVADDASLVRPVIGLAALFGHKQVTDLHLVNLAVSHGGRLVTFDQKIAATLTGSDNQGVLTLG